MQTTYNIKILESDTNKIGDLFGRLMGDLFLALGYTQVRLNIHKSGREIDIEVEHRTEPRKVIAECKATQDKIGGDSINKFIGALDVERRKDANNQITGYFISLSGFKETTIEQEKEAGGGRVVLLEGKQVVDELINGHIIVSLEKAMERAGRSAKRQPVNLHSENCELLAHDMGWIWAIYFTQNKQRTHFALIHADGEPIALSLAENIIKCDSSVGGTLHTLIYLHPPIESSVSEVRISQAKTKYFEYLASECGEITLEGMPADQDVGSRRLKLENIFVPLYLEPSSENKQDLSTSIREEQDSPDPEERIPVGNILCQPVTRLAILSVPGGGKTTLLKRLAVAYAFPDRRNLSDDDLPERPWFPLLVRCRQLGETAKSPICDILRTISQRAEMTELTEAFMLIVNNALRSGDILLLIDGLDEISDEGARISFVKQLRTFLATYPNISIIVTSREPGFRLVGGSLSTHCQLYKVSDFDEEDITQLTVAWHKEVIGNRQEVLSEAKKLAETIIDSDRLQQLAKNPLLLTTLLLVKRWVGQLPTRRSVLYGKAIEVLLMTWNVEGYEPIDQEEAIPQLAFVAFTMMKNGVQRISSRQLNEILTQARKQMPEVLGYAKYSVSEFVQRIELRSSLLILSGHEVENGTLYPFYEFRHLTFQEYLTARAIVNGYYPDRNDNDTLLNILNPHLEDERWKEVVPLLAVLAGRNAQPLIRCLIDLCKNIKHAVREREFSPINLLSQSFLDEIQVSPDLLEEGLGWIVRRTLGPSRIILLLFRGKYGKILQKIIYDVYSNSDTDLFYSGSALATITLDQMGWFEFRELHPQFLEKITILLNSEDPIQKAAGALAIMHVAFYCSRPINKRKGIAAETKKLLQMLGDQLISILYSDKPHCYFAACWAFAWLGERDGWNPDCKPEVIARLLEIWRNSQLADIQEAASWAISSLPIIDRVTKSLPEPNQDLIDFVKQESLPKDEDKSSNKYERKLLASLVIGYYLKTPWTDEELAQLVMPIAKREKGHLVWFPIKSFLKALGRAGEDQLALINQKQPSDSKKSKVKAKKDSKQP